MLFYDGAKDNYINTVPPLNVTCVYQLALVILYIDFIIVFILFHFWPKYFLVLMNLCSVFLKLVYQQILFTLFTNILMIETSQGKD